MQKRTDVITMGGNKMTLAGEEVKLNDKAKDFTCLKSDLSPFSLSDVKEKAVIISVVPSIDTPVCDLQTTTFNEKAHELKDVKVLTISNDLPFAHARFCAAKGIDSVITLSDHKDLDFGSKYGFVIDELRLLARGIVVLDENRNVAHVEYVSEVTNHPNYDKAIEAAKKILEA